VKRAGRRPGIERFANLDLARPYSCLKEFDLDSPGQIVKQANKKQHQRDEKPKRDGSEEGEQQDPENAQCGYGIEGIIQALQMKQVHKIPTKTLTENVNPDITPALNRAALGRIKTEKNHAAQERRQASDQRPRRKAPARERTQSETPYYKGPRAHAQPYPFTCASISIGAAAGSIAFK
jgi:hypothetical protein